MSGNLGDDIIIDESNKSSNGIYLYYGNSEANKLYFASAVDISTYSETGDGYTWLTKVGDKNYKIISSLEVHMLKIILGRYNTSVWVWTNICCNCT